MVENKINSNARLNDFLIASGLFFNSFSPEDDSLVLDFDHQFIPCEKYDSTYNYKSKRGYFGGVASISDAPCMSRAVMGTLMRKQDS